MNPVIDDFQKQLATFKLDLTTGTHIKEIPVLNQELEPLDYKMYAVLFSSKPLADHLRTQLKELASLGLLVAIDGDTYREISLGNKQGARKTIKAFTQHNDKLGADFSNLKRQYRVSLSPQYKSSAYPKFLADAAAFYVSKGKAKLAQHFEAASKKFTITDDQRDAFTAQQRTRIALPSAESTDLKIGAL